MPVSVTASSIRPLPSLAEMDSLPPAGVYFMALSSRLVTAWSSRGSSATSSSPSGSTRRSKEWFFSLMRSSRLAVIFFIRGISSIFFSSSGVSLDSILDRLRRSFIRLSRRLACFSMIPRNRLALSVSSSAPSLRVSTKPLMEARGVLSSWETFATNSTRIFSSFLRSVTSWRTIAAPETWADSLMGEIWRLRAVVLPGKKSVNSIPPRLPSFSTSRIRLMSLGFLKTSHRYLLRAFSLGRRSIWTAASLILNILSWLSTATTPSVILERSASSWFLSLAVAAVVCSIPWAIWLRPRESCPSSS